MVPVAVNLYKVRRAPGPAGDLFRSVQRQKDQYQGLWLVTPDGKVVTGHHDFKTTDPAGRTEEVLAALEAGLKTYGPVKPRQVKAQNPLPHRGRGMLPDGVVNLALYTRHVHNGRADGRLVIDSITLGRDQWAKLAPPPGAAAGTKWQIPEDVGRLFSRALSPSSDQSTMALPSDVTAVALSGTVREVKDGIARVEYEGRIAATHRAEMKENHAEGVWTGSGEYDTRKRQMESLTLVLEGTYRHFPPYDSPRGTGALVEWRLAADGR